MKEALRAVTFSTPDPFQNYREGLQIRAKDTPMLPAMPSKKPRMSDRPPTTKKA